MPDWLRDAGGFTSYFQTSAICVGTAGTVGTAASTSTNSAPKSWEQTGNEWEHLALSALGSPVLFPCSQLRDSQWEHRNPRYSRLFPLFPLFPTV